MKKETKLQREKATIAGLRHHARRMSIREGSFSTIRQSLGDSYITPFAIAINSSNFIIAMLSSISGLVGPMGQWFSSRLMEKYSRKKIVLTAIFYECLMWIPLILTAFLFYKGILTSFLPMFVLILFSLYVIIANLAGPAWFSWVGDLVDPEYRGKWFSKRNLIHGTVLVIFTLLASFFLDYLKKKNLTIFGFMILFFLAMIARFIAREYFKKSYEPKLKLEKNYYFSFWQFIKKAPSNNFGRFTIFRAIMDFSVSIAGPFFAIYMLRNLGFSYTTFMIVTLSQTLFGLLVMKQWGRFADKYGNYTVMKLTIIIVGIFPFLWLISPNPIFLIFVPSLIGGIGWAGFNLAASNFIFDSVTPQRRGICVSYYNVLNGIGIFLGAGLGAILIKTWTIPFMETILFIFVISGIARLASGLILLPSFREVRETEKFKSGKALIGLVPKIIKIPMVEGTYEIFTKKRFRWKK